MDCKLAVKVAVTEAGLARFSVQVEVPLQAPLQPVKVKPASGVAESVIGDPVWKFAMQLVPQLIPAGLLDTVPVPEPAVATVT